MSDTDFKIIPAISTKRATEIALEIIEEERSGKQLGLKTRFSSLNIALRKYFRFNTVNLFAGLSGHGKSYFLNELNEDFLDYGEGGINQYIDFIPIIFQFCFEMSAYNEILRTCAADLGFNYNYLLSSQWDKENKEYNKLTDEELQQVKNFMQYYQNKSILFFETSANLNIIYNTVNYYYTHYQKLHKQKGGKPYKFIVNIDHTLLIEKLNEKDTLDLMSKTGAVAIKIRKSFGAMVNLIGQLNNNIESTERILKPQMHFPMKSDIYAQGQLYNACDSVFVIHQPSMLGIKQYGTQKWDSRGLIHFLVLKARHGSIGSIKFLNALSKGKIIEYPESDNQVKEDNNLDK